MAQRLVAYAAPVLAVDGPTGLDLSSGEAHGPVRAQVTITFGGPRRGHLLAREWCGKLIVVDIGLPPADPAWPVLVTDAWAGARGGADALVVGPGLGREPPQGEFLAGILKRKAVPTVLDADALPLFQGPAERPLVCTPHLGEFRALAGDALADAVANDRWEA